MIEKFESEFEEACNSEASFSTECFSDISIPILAETEEYICKVAETTVREASISSNMENPCVNRGATSYQMMCEMARRDAIIGTFRRAA